MTKPRRILIAGGNGLVGRALIKRMSREAELEILAPSRSELDLENRSGVREFVQSCRPDAVVMAAALVGGIVANMEKPVDFLVKNVDMQNNLMLEAVEAGVETVVFLGSSCIYPRQASQPMREDAFMTGPLEPTNEPYAVAKIAGIRLAQALSAQYGTRVVLPMPSNVYGPGDHFDLARSHVLSALVKRFVDAQRLRHDGVELWGTGSARREFLHSEDLADAVYFLMKLEDDLGIINVGTGEDISIRDLAYLIAEFVGFEGEIKWDTTRPDGMPRKLMNVERLKSAGWTPRIRLESGIPAIINEYRSLPLGQSRT